jgi:two-component system response regulator PilR (NtrC family)
VDDEGDAGFISQSESMIEVREMVDRLAGMPTTVLISGESGTGKERIARALHRGGQRARDVFIPLNCGAIPETLIESELFGHVRGAFTGADKDREGVILAARGGTLFLDEIGELPLVLQPKLLRVLQEKKVRPVGSEQEVSVDDVRIVAATNRDLEAEVRIGRFREDLYFRLNVVEIALPPLRQRREDIAQLSYGFLKKFSKRYPRQVTQIAPEAMGVLMSYTYPGNVRQLENAMERCVALARGACVSVNDLPKEFLTKPGARGPSGVATGDVAAFPEAGVDLARLVERFEYQWIQRALAAAGGVKTRAAELLNLSFRQFRYKLSKYDDSEPGQGSRGDDT